MQLGNYFFPPEDQYQNYLDSVYRYPKTAVGRFTRYTHRLRIETIASLLKDMPGMKILDIGCGGGGLCYRLQESNQVTGLDYSKAAIKMVRDNRQNFKIKFKTILASAEKLPFQKESFDVIIGSEIIEHLSRPSLVLAEVKRVLKKKGCFICTIPNSASLCFGGLYIISRIFKSASKLLSKETLETHLRYNMVTSCDLVKGSGLIIEKVGGLYLVPFHIILLWGQKTGGLEMTGHFLNQHFFDSFLFKRYGAFTLIMAKKH